MDTYIHIWTFTRLWTSVCTYVCALCAVQIVCRFCLLLLLSGVTFQIATNFGIHTVCVCVWYCCVVLCAIGWKNKTVYVWYYTALWTLSNACIYRVGRKYNFFFECENWAKSDDEKSGIFSYYSVRCSFVQAWCAHIWPQQIFDSKFWSYVIVYWSLFLSNLMMFKIMQI